MGIAPGVLGEAAVFFVVALLLLSYLGVGISALTLPGRLRACGWLIAPFMGYSLLVVVCAWLVAFGANVRTALIAALVLATVANGWALRTDRRLASLGSVRWWGALAAMAVPLYAIPALTMAHNGSTAYIGGQSDINYVLPLVEWVKTHSSGLLSLGPGISINPHWIGSIAPIGGWNAPGAHLGYSYPFSSDIQTIFQSDIQFQRGAVYLQAAIGIILDRDSYLVYGPTMAFMLSLSPPAVFLLCRQLIGANCRASLLAALFVGLNGTLYFWIAFGHLGQSVTASLLPVSLVLTISALECRAKRATVLAALVLSALLASYYWAITPILGVLVVPSILYLLAKSHERRYLLERIGLVVGGVILFALPEHIKLVLAWRAGALMQVPGFDDPTFVPLSDGFGTTLYARILDLVAGNGQVGEFALNLLQFASAIATAVAILVALAGVASSNAERSGLYRAMLLGVFGLMAYLRLTNYPYGYAKAEASMTFMFAVAMSLGIDRLWRLRLVTLEPAIGLGFLSRWRVSLCRGAVQALPSYALAGAPLLLLSGMLAVNLTLSAYAFWKPVGNIWDPRAWEAHALTKILSPGASVGVSGNILAAPESLFATLYFLRNQTLGGTFSLDMFGKKVLQMSGASPQLAGSPRSEDDFELLGASEVAAMKGSVPSDLVWSGSIAKAYRRNQGERGIVAVKAPAGDTLSLPARLPTLVEADLAAEPLGNQAAQGAGYLLVVLAADAPTTVAAISYQPSAISPSPREPAFWAVHTAPDERRWTAGREEQTFRIGSGVSVRSIQLTGQDRIQLSAEGDASARLLAATVRTGSSLPPDEDYPSVLAAVGQSSLKGNVATTRFAYLDIGVLAFHSLDIYNANGNSHRAWFELPTYPDKQLRDIQADLDLVTLDHRASMDGADVPGKFSAQPYPDGEYVMCFSIWSATSLVKSIPLYRYRLEGGRVTEFESFELAGVWDGQAMGGGGQ